ncbi:hypothetical protein BFW01_g2813 [Lasiodiplodia theobromae]|nr:hypothetical protein BFW01_g2813 [Lasiodiplodia theobromae]
MPSDRHHHRRHATRSRSRSPRRDDDNDHRSRRSHRTRSRSRSHSPHSRRSHHHHHRSHHRHESKHAGTTARSSKPSSSSAAPTTLPFSARPLSKHGDYRRYKPMFALYLDIQKQLVLEELPETEVKGRWKSFVGKWNRGELAEGWYDPVTLQKAIDSSAENDLGGSNEDKHTEELPQRQRRASPDYGSNGTPGEREPAYSEEPGHGRDKHQSEQDEDEEDEEDEFGPAALPSGAISASMTRKSGPAIPRREDLEYRDELLASDAHSSQNHLRALRAADRALQRTRLDELAPRADPGSHERKLEKRAEKTSTLHSFREAKEGGAMEEVGDSDLMGGGGGDGVEDFRARRKEQERRKTEREVRREEMLRARAAEREEKFAEYRAKEDRTMEMLRGLARARFGGGGGGNGGQ